MGGVTASLNPHPLLPDLSLDASLPHPSVKVWNKYLVVPYMWFLTCGVKRSVNISKAITLSSFKLNLETPFFQGNKENKLTN